MLKAVQEDASLSQAELAAVTGMSRTSVWRRIRDFEECGLIERQVMLLNPKLTGFHLQVRLAVSMIEHTDDNRQAFEDHVKRLSMVTECCTISGEWDYVLSVVALDMEHYNDFLLTEILAHPAVRSASSSFVLQRVKHTTAIPVDMMGG